MEQTWVKQLTGRMQGAMKKKGMRILEKVRTEKKNMQQRLWAGGERREKEEKGKTK